MRGEKGSEGWWRSGKGKGKGGWFFPGDVPWREPIRRGEALLMWGYACDEVTHCVRSPDVPGRRFAIIVRVVRHGAPMHTSLDECMRPRDMPAPGGTESALLERPVVHRERQGDGAPVAPPPRAPRPRPPAGPPPAGPSPQPMPPAPLQQYQHPQPPFQPPFPFQLPYQFPMPPFPGQPQLAWPFSGTSPPFPFPFPTVASQPQAVGAQPSVGGPPQSPPPQSESAAGEGPRAGAPTPAPAAARRQIERLRGVWYLSAVSGLTWRITVPEEGFEYTMRELGGAERTVRKAFTFSLRGSLCTAGRELKKWQMDEDAVTGQAVCSAVEWDGGTPWVRAEPRGRTVSPSTASSSSSASSSPSSRQAEAPRRRRAEAAPRVIITVPPSPPRRGRPPPPFVSSHNVRSGAPRRRRRAGGAAPRRQRSALPASIKHDRWELREWPTAAG
eukprot:gene3794-biopygen16985